MNPLGVSSNLEELGHQREMLSSCTDCLHVGDSAVYLQLESDPGGGAGIGGMEVRDPALLQEDTEKSGLGNLWGTMWHLTGD